MKRNSRIVGLILALGLFNGLLWSFVIPYDRAPDEVDHFLEAEFMAREKRLPVLGVDFHVHEWPSGELRLPYCALPGILTYVPASLTLVAGTLVAENVGPHHLARLGSVIGSLLILVLAWRFARHAFGNDPLGLAVPLLVAVIPQFAFTSSYVNNDIWTGVSSAFLVFVCSRALRQGWTWSSCLLLGCACGLVGLSKMNAFCLFPATAFLWILTLRGKGSDVAIRVIVVGTMASLSCGWWFLRSFELYGDPLGIQGFAPGLAAIGRTVPEPGNSYGMIVTTPSWWGLTFASFWGVFDYFGVFMHPAWYAGAAVVCVIAGIGWCRRILGKRGVHHENSAHDRLLAIFCAGAVLVALAVLPLPSRYTFQPQGRYLYPVLLPVAYLLVAGLRYAAGPITGRRIVAATTVFLCLFQMMALWGRLLPWYRL